MKAQQLTVAMLLAVGFTVVPTLALAEETGAAENPDLYEEVGEEDYWVDENYAENEELVGPPEGEVDVTYFYQELAPYGQWLWSQEHGWVWQPAGLDEEWRPFSYGRWVYSDYGWTWVSYYPWGWAAFHYGAWAYLPDVGWVWVPGVVWSPARVVWRYSTVYVGWSPIIAGYDYYYGWGYYPIHYHHWSFIHWHLFCHHHLHHHFVHHHHVQHVFHHTHYPKHCRDRAGGSCHHGPSARKVAQKTGNAVPWQRVKRPASPKEARARVQQRPSKAPGVGRAENGRARPAAVNQRPSRAPSSKSPRASSAPTRPTRSNASAAGRSRGGGTSAATMDTGRRSIRERPAAASRTPSRGATIKPTRPASKPPSKTFKPRSTKVRPPARVSTPDNRGRTTTRPSGSYGRPSGSVPNPRIFTTPG